MVNKKRKVAEDTEEKPPKKTKVTATKSVEETIDESQIKTGKKLFVENGYSVEVIVNPKPRVNVFEITNESDELLHSKLETKRYPTLQKLGEILDSL
eukprot:gene9830-2152_t